jgi:hypothetical protein
MTLMNRVCCLATTNTSTGSNSHAKYPLLDHRHLHQKQVMSFRGVAN